MLLIILSVESGPKKYPKPNQNNNKNKTKSKTKEKKKLSLITEGKKYCQYSLSHETSNPILNHSL